MTFIYVKKSPSKELKEVEYSLASLKLIKEQLEKKEVKNPAQKEVKKTIKKIEKIVKKTPGKFLKKTVKKTIKKVPKVEKLTKTVKKQEKKKALKAQKQSAKSLKKVKKFKKDYFSQLRTKIDQNKKYPLRSKRFKEEGKSYLAFTVIKTGHFTKIRLLKSSGYARLDKAALKALKKTKKFKSFPKNIKKEFLDFTLVIDFKLD